MGRNISVGFSLIFYFITPTLDGKGCGAEDGARDRGRIHVKIPMRRLREVREEAQPLYQVAAGLFRGDVPRAAPRGMEADKSDGE